MQLVTYGINHNTAPINILERIAFNEDVLPVALNSLKQHPNVIEAVVLSTCNRTEIYCHLSGDYSNVINLWLHQFHHQDPDSLTQFLYQYEGDNAVRHLLRVAPPHGRGYRAGITSAGLRLAKLIRNSQ